MGAPVFPFLPVGGEARLLPRFFSASDSKTLQDHSFPLHHDPGSEKIVAQPRRQRGKAPDWAKGASVRAPAVRW